MDTGKSLKPLVLYHASCLDGYAAAFAAWLKLGDEAEYVPMQYGKDDLPIEIDTMCYDKDVYILDFSFPKGTMDIIFSSAKRVVWLDHHKTAFEMWCGEYHELSKYEDHDSARRHITLDNNKSGAYLAWEYFHPRTQTTLRQETRPWAIHFNGYGDDSSCLPGFMEDEHLYAREAAEREAGRMDALAKGMGCIPAVGQACIYEARLAPKGYGEEFSEVPLFIRHIDDYDRWQFKIEGTKAFQKALWSYAPWSFERWEDWFHDGEGVNDEFIPYARWYAEGEAILRAHDQNVQSVVKGSARKCRITIKTEQYGCTGEPGLAANCPPHLTSDVGHELATQSGTFGLCWTLGQSGTVAKCSLRSNGEYDVSAIAKSFGGGGHRNAAGFEVDIQTLLGWLK